MTIVEMSRFRCEFSLDETKIRSNTRVRSIIRLCSIFEHLTENMPTILRNGIIEYSLDVFQEFLTKYSENSVKR